MSAHPRRRTGLAALAVASVLAAMTTGPAAADPAADGDPAVAGPEALAAGSGPVRYVHDANGRLVTTMDASGQVARWTYDPAGHVLSVARSSAAAHSVVDLSPRSASPGQQVSVVGRGFSSTASDNAVTIGGKSAKVVSASPTELVVTVPAGAGTGGVQVTTGGAVATGATLTVAPSRAPVVTGTSPARTVPGSSFTVTGSGFTTAPGSTWVALNGTRAVVTSVSATSLTATVPDHVTSGRVTVGTPWGRATSAGDLTVAPAPLATGDVAGTERVALGRATTVAVGTAGKVALALFDGRAGQRVTLTTTASTFGYSYLSLLRPDGEPVVDRVGSSGDRFVDTVTLHDDGTYTVVVDPDEADTGSLSLLVRDVAPDVTGTLTVDGAARTVHVTTPGQNGLLTFAGTAGQRVALTTTSTTMDDFTDYVLTAPDGTRLHGTYVSPGASAWSDALTLPATGTYRLTVDPEEQGVGDVSFRLRSVPPDVTGTLTVGGAARTLSVTTPGQNGALTFAGSAGQRVALDVTSTTMDDYEDYEVRAPDGTRVFGSYVSPGLTSWSDVQVLPQTGTYTLLADPEDQGVGDVRYKLAAVPADTTGTMSVGGATRTVTTSAPGQNATLTFSGSAGQRVALSVQSTTMNDYEDFEVRAPGGARVYGSYVSAGGSAWSDVLTLPGTGTYTLLADPEGKGVGEVTYRLDAVAGDVTGTVTPGGAPVTVTTTTPGQNGVLTFSGTSGQSLQLTASGSTSSTDTDLVVRAPGGAVVRSTWVSPGGSTTTPAFALPSTGTYTLVVDPEGKGTGSVTVRLLNGSGAPVAQAPARLLTATRPHEPVPSAAPARSRPALGARQRDLSWWHPRATRPAPFTASDGPADEDTPYAHLAAPQAPAGQTALTGQVLSVDGLPLPGVAVGLAGVQATTDAQGWFLLRDVPAGKGELQVDGTTADTATTRWGFYEVFVDVLPGRTTVLPWTTWMTPLDMSSAVALPTTTTSEVVVKTAQVPGLEFHVPAGASVQGRDGAPVHEVTLTAIPVERPPFPLPQLGVEVPVYFTLQPGSATVLPAGGQIWYPNYSHEPAGKKVEFWSYEPDEGWEVYGYGHVSPDGTQVLPDPGTRITEFTGAMFNAGNSPPGKGPKPGGGSGGDPVDLGTGLYVQSTTDLSLPATVPLSVERTYRPGDDVSRTFGTGAALGYDMFLWSAHQYTEVDLVLPDGGRVHMLRTSPGTGYSDAVFEAGLRPDSWSRARMAWDADLFGWRLVTNDGAQYEFVAYTPLRTVRDRAGNEVRLHRDPAKRLLEATTSDGRWVRFDYDDADRVTAATDDTGRTVRYAYDAAGELSSVTDPTSAVTAYTYDAQHRMTKVVDGRGATVLTNAYDASDRVVSQTDGAGGTWGFAWTAGADGAVTRADVTDPRGAVRRVDLDAGGALVQQVEALGTGKARTTTWTRSPEGLLLATVDPLGRRTEYAYEPGTGLPTKVTTLAGTGRAATWTTAYTPDHLVAKVTDPLGRVTKYAYAPSGALASVTDPAGSVRLVTSDARGRVLSVTEPTGGRSTVTWSLGDPVAVTDPLGRTTSWAVDGTGRGQGETDPEGSTTRYAFDRAGRLTAVTDPLGGVVKYGYDAVGDVTSVTDQRGARTAFSYDGLQRRLDRTDPLGAVDRLVRDPSGAVTGRTRRTGAASSYGYDVLGRRTSAAYGGATVAMSYDAGDRLVKLNGPGGTVTRTWDALDGVASETTSAGTVRYGYDRLGRTTSVQLGSDPATTYAYDALDRTTTATRGAAVVTTAYDASSRPTLVTLPDGVQVQRTYDAAGQVTRVRWVKGTTVLRVQSYGYDLAGRRSSVSGSAASVVLPDAVGSAAYDGAGRLTSWGGKAVTSDADGNVTSFGGRAYSWDARDRLVAVGGPVTAAYSYDDLGRRTSATVGGTSTTYAYDGTDVLAETTGGTRVPALLGPGEDQRYGRLLPGGGEWLLPDALGSTAAVADDSGAVTTSYAYTPYGATTRTGPSTNPFTFTGRETDATGLSLHRARWLSPVLSQWMSEDPIGFGGGTADLTEYAAGDPVDLVDLDGLESGPPPPSDCGLFCSLLKRVFKKTASDAAKEFPGPPKWDKPWKPSPRGEYEKQLQQYGEDANRNGNQQNNAQKDVIDKINDAMGGG